MLNVNNRKTIRSISVASLRAGKLRNVIAICAIALTAMLFTALFTIAITINTSIQQSNFRQTGGYAHGGFKSLSAQQLDELKTDPLIKEYGWRRFVGMPNNPPFHKSHVEISHADAKQAKWMYLEPKSGQYPKEGTNEAATDTEVLSLLGVEPVIGTEFTLTFLVDGKETTQTFTLSGFWEADEAFSAHHVLIPASRAEDIFNQLGTIGKDGMTGKYFMEVMFQNSWNIKENIETILQNHGYQSSNPNGENYVGTGVNWGYSSAQLLSNGDPSTVVGIIALLLIISFTGYLIIYNVFQISVAGDIRFYGLLKTIGTTPRQLRRIIRRQALLLSLIGIPLGLILGYLLALLLNPIVFAQLNSAFSIQTDANPLIFLVSALFALGTVFLSCAKPGRIAANVSPIEAIRFSEGGKNAQKIGGKMHKSGKTGVSLPKMALANLGRTKGKTTVTVMSLSLAVLLLNITFTFTNGFDMDKYLKDMVTDFILAQADYFQSSHDWNSNPVDADTIAMIEKQSGVTGSGCTYGLITPTLQFVTEERYREVYEKYATPDQVTRFMENSQRLPDGRVSDRVSLYGMEDFVLSKLNVFQGDIEKLKDTSGNYIAAHYLSDDYGNIKPDSNWAKLGDKVTLRHVDEHEFYNPETGEVYDGAIPDGAPFEERILAYHDVEYTVAALVQVPSSLNYRFYGSDEFIMSADLFKRDTDSQSIMYYTFDVEDDSAGAMEQIMADYTGKTATQYDYESKETYRQEFEGFRGMFVLMGSVLSAIIGLVGILNFLNAVITSIITRRKELAMLQAIGMTGKQLKTLLVCESLIYTLGAVSICLLISLAVAPLLASTISTVFWFFTYRFTVLPVFLCLPFMVLISVFIPTLGYRSLTKQSIVDRIRESE